MRGHRSRGNLRGGGRAGFQWRRNDRANPGPSRPANPGPNNVSQPSSDDWLTAVQPNYHQWNNHHGERWSESYSEQDSGERSVQKFRPNFNTIHDTFELKLLNLKVKCIAVHMVLMLVRCQEGFLKIPFL